MKTIINFGKHKENTLTAELVDTTLLCQVYWSAENRTTPIISFDVSFFEGTVMVPPDPATEFDLVMLVNAMLVDATCGAITKEEFRNEFNTDQNYIECQKTMHKFHELGFLTKSDIETMQKLVSDLGDQLGVSDDII